MKLIALKTLNIADKFASDDGLRVRAVAIGEEFNVLDADAKQYLSRKLAEKPKAAKAEQAVVDVEPKVSKDK